MLAANLPAYLTLNLGARFFIYNNVNKKCSKPKQISATSRTELGHKFGQLGVNFRIFTSDCFDG